MPNHVTHRVWINGPQEALTSFKSTFLVTKLERHHDGTESRYTLFDFEVVVPMPDLIRHTESSSVINDGLLILGRTEISDAYGWPEPAQKRLERYLSYPWVKETGVRDLESLKRLLLARSPDCLEKAQRAVEAYDTYGYSSWYSWSVANWGTKWNSYGFEIIHDGDDGLEFRFNTAWSSPEPIFAALADRPETKDLTINILAFDEGWNFAFVAGIHHGQYLGREVDASDEIYQRVYGYAAPPAD